MKAREERRSDERKREMTERYFEKTELSIHQRTIKLIARCHASIGDRPRFSMPSATKLCVLRFLSFPRLSVCAFCFHGRFRLFPREGKKMYFLFSSPSLIYRAIIRARSTECNVAERRRNAGFGGRRENFNLGGCYFNLDANEGDAIPHANAD